MAAGTDRALTVEDKDYWETLFKVGKTPWELNTFAPPLKTFLDSPYAVPPGTIAVLGAGTGHDAMLFARYGFTVVAIDFAPSAIKATEEKFKSAGILGKTGFLLERDIFSLHEYAQSFDYVLAHLLLRYSSQPAQSLFLHCARFTEAGRQDDRVMVGL